MPIIINLDVMMAKRKISLGELAEKIDLTPANLSILKTGNISEWSDQGKHTTTFAEMIDLPFGGKLIDTPGIRELGIVDIEKQELSHFFPEMRKLLNKCRFNNCRHINEPGCVVLEAIELGDIDTSRYDSYLSIYNNQDSRT